MLGVATGVTDLFPDLRNALIERSRSSKILYPPDFFENTITVQDFATVIVEKANQFQFSWSQRGRLAPEGDLVIGSVNGRFSDREGGFRLRFVFFLILSSTIAAPEQSLYPCEQFDNGKRLRHIVIGTAVQANDLVHLLSFRS